MNYSSLQPLQGLAILELSTKYTHVCLRDICKAVTHFTYPIFDMFYHILSLYSSINLSLSSLSCICRGQIRNRASAREILYYRQWRLGKIHHNTVTTQLKHTNSTEMILQIAILPRINVLDDLCLYLCKKTTKEPC